MQPYFFPWIGYFQLIYQSDVFVLYDDANFIKQGYINRNSILVDGQAQRFTLPVPSASSFKRIGELTFSLQVEKIARTLEQSYRKAPFLATSCRWWKKRYGIKIAILPHAVGSRLTAYPVTLGWSKT
jgi:hypothetical protein